MNVSVRWKFRFSLEIFCLVTLARSCIRWTAMTKIRLANQDMRRGRNWNAYVLVGAKRHFCTRRSPGTGFYLQNRVVSGVAASWITKLAGLYDQYSISLVFLPNDILQQGCRTVSLKVPRKQKKNKRSKHKYKLGVFYQGVGAKKYSASSFEITMNSQQKLQNEHNWGKKYFIRFHPRMH